MRNGGRHAATLRRVVRRTHLLLGHEVVRTLLPLLLALTLSLGLLRHIGRAPLPERAPSSTEAALTPPSRAAAPLPLSGSRPDAVPVYYLVDSADEAAAVRRQAHDARDLQILQGGAVPDPLLVVVVIRSPEEEVRTMQMIADDTRVRMVNGQQTPRVVDLRAP